MDNKKQDMEKPSARKGQAAMEYLMTYGWAILVIVIVLAVLWFYLPRLLSMATPAGCVFASGFDCSEPPPTIYSSKDNNDLRVTVKIRNHKGRTVDINSVLCTDASLEEVTREIGHHPAQGQDVIIAGGSKTYDIVCKNKNNGTMTKAADTDFRGLLIVWYVYEDDLRSDIFRKDEAVLTGTVLSQE